MLANQNQEKNWTSVSKFSILKQASSLNFKKMYLLIKESKQIELYYKDWWFV